MARRWPSPTPPREAQAGFGQTCIEVSTWRRPRVDTRRGGGAAGAGKRGAGAGSQASQCGLVMRPAKGRGSRWRLGTGEGSAGVVRHAAESLGHAEWSMRQGVGKETCSWSK